MRYLKNEFKFLGHEQESCVSKWDRIQMCLSVSDPDLIVALDLKRDLKEILCGRE